MADAERVPARDDVRPDDLVEEVVAAAGGDWREAILGLVRGQHELRAEAELLSRDVSAGYVRRRLREGRTPSP